MKLNDFVNKWNGEHVEVAGSANALNQCVDLANLYIKTVWGKPIIQWTNAVDFPSRMPAPDYEFIENTPEAVPPEGCLMIWNNTKVGHIAIFIEGSVKSFRSFDQNYPTGSPCHIQNHTYSGVFGWIIKKDSIIKPPQIEAQMNDQTKIPLGEKWGDVEIQAIRSMLRDSDKLKDELEKWKTKYEELVKIQLGMKDEFTTKLETTKQLAEDRKRERDELISELAKILGTTQEKAVIVADIKKTIADNEKLKNISDNRPVYGDNWIQSLTKLLGDFFNNLYLKIK